MTIEKTVKAMYATTEVLQGLAPLLYEVEIQFEERGQLYSAAFDLQKALYVLLPPRGPGATVTCPHCSNDLEVSVSKP